MALIDLITEDVIKVPLIATEKIGVLRELVELLRKAGKITKADMVFESLLERESLGSTGLENGVAVPHGKTEAVPSLALAIGIAPQGIDFDALDGEPSKLFFCMVAPPDQSGPHIEALSEIAKLTMSTAFCRTLAAARTPAEVVELFKE